MAVNGSHQSQGAELCPGVDVSTAPLSGTDQLLSGPQAFWHCIHRCVSHFLTRAAGNDKPCRQHDTLITVTPRKSVPLQGSSCAWCCHQGSACVRFQESRHPSEQGSPGTQPAPGKWGAKPPSGSRAADGESAAFGCAVRPQAPLSATTPRVQMRVFQRKPKPFL